MPRDVISRLAEALNAARTALNGAKILLLGAAHKKDIDDAREALASTETSRLESFDAVVKMTSSRQNIAFA